MCIIDMAAKAVAEAHSSHDAASAEIAETAFERPPITIITWNVNALNPLLPTIKAEHGTFDVFLDILGVDILCLQVLHLLTTSGRIALAPFLLQETKLRFDNVPHELLNLNGWQSVWYCSEKKGISQASSRFLKLSIERDFSVLQATAEL